jgi:hypothetical protein
VSSLAKDISIAMQNCQHSLLGLLGLGVLGRGLCWMSGHCTQSGDEMMRINQMNHCHKDTVILLNLNVINIKIKVVVKG